MKYLMMTTAVIEIGAGLAFLCFPSQSALLLVGSPIQTAVGLSVGRVTGAALCALSLANWLASYDAQSAAARGVVSAMVLYNIAAFIILAASGIWSPPVGSALWPAVILHIAMSVWCIFSLLKPQPLPAK